MEIRRWGVLGGVVILVAISLVWVFRPVSVVQKHGRMQKTVVFDKAQYVFKPVHEITDDAHYLKLLMTIHSYVDPQLLGYDYRRVTVLETDQVSIQPTDVTVIESTDHSLMVQFLFELPDSATPTVPFSIKLFTHSDNHVDWD